MRKVKDIRKMSKTGLKRYVLLVTLMLRRIFKKRIIHTVFGSVPSKLLKYVEFDIFDC